MAELRFDVVLETKKAQRQLQELAKNGIRLPTGNGGGNGKPTNKSPGDDEEKKQTKGIQAVVDIGAYILQILKKIEPVVQIMNAVLALIGYLVAWILKKFGFLIETYEGDKPTDKTTAEAMKDLKKYSQATAENTKSSAESQKKIINQTEYITGLTQKQIDEIKGLPAKSALELANKLLGGKPGNEVNERAGAFGTGTTAGTGVPGNFGPLSPEANDAVSAALRGLPFGQGTSKFKTQPFTPKSKTVSDAIVSGGQVIQTSPNDMILATNKQSGGMGGTKNFYFYGVTPQEMINVIKAELGGNVWSVGRM